MEDFSQSRGDDDLFDDEIIPIENPPSPEKITTQLNQVSLESTPVPPPIEVVSAAVPAPSSAAKPASTESPFPGFKPKPRGRGGHVSVHGEGTRQASTGLEDSKWAAKPADSAKPATRAGSAIKSPTEEAQPSATQIENITPVEAQTLPAAEDTASPTTSAPANPPTGPSNPQPANKTPAVRGDRTLTGGLARTKLTEEELSAKLAAAKLRSETVAAAHARAQADAASFEERERMASEKRAVEWKERRVMEGERERNRLRKLGNREGREWDRDKDEQATNGRGGRRSYDTRGEDDDLRQYEWHDDRGRGRGRGRGGRGGRGRGGLRGSGGFGPGRDHQAQQQPDVSAETDFPSLPGSASNPTPSKKDSSEAKTTVNDASKPSPQRWDSSGSGGGTWADQVESSESNVENTSKPK